MLISIWDPNWFFGYFVKACILEGSGLRYYDDNKRKDILDGTPTCFLMHSGLKYEVVNTWWGLWLRQVNKATKHSVSMKLTDSCFPNFLKASCSQQSIVINIIGEIARKNKT